MKHDGTTPPLRERALGVPPPAPGVAIATMGDEELEQLRRALADALAHVRLGSPASALLGWLSCQTRAEQRRRARQTAPPAAGRMSDRRANHRHRCDGGATG